MMSLFYTAPVPQGQGQQAELRLPPGVVRPVQDSSLHPGQVAHAGAQLQVGSGDRPEPSGAAGQVRRSPVGIDLPTISQRLIADEGADKNATTLENSGALQNADLPKSKTRASRLGSSTAPTPCVDYEVLNVQKIKDVNVRKAIAMAINRQAHRDHLRWSDVRLGDRHHRVAVDPVDRPELRGRRTWVSSRPVTRPPPRRC